MVKKTKKKTSGVIPTRLELIPSTCRSMMFPALETRNISQVATSRWCPPSYLLLQKNHSVSIYIYIYLYHKPYSYWTSKSRLWFMVDNHDQHSYKTINVNTTTIIKLANELGHHLAALMTRAPRVTRCDQTPHEWRIATERFPWAIAPGGARKALQEV